MEPDIELAKPRDFGEIIGDTFLFIRQNFKDLVKNFFIFCGFFIIAGILSTCIAQYKMMSLSSEIASGGPQTFNSLSGIWVNVIAMAVLGIFGYCANFVAIISFISLYKQKGNVAPTTEEVWGFFKYYFFRIVLAALIIWILLGLGFMFCIIPGVWLFPIFGLIFPIMIVENTSFSYAFSRSFTLIKDNWWATAGAVFVIWLITYAMMAIFSLPVQAVSFASLILRPKAAMPTLSLGSIIFSAVLQQLLQLLVIIPAIGICLCYFNLSESKDGTSLLDRINKFGEGNTPTDTANEEY